MQRMLELISILNRANFAYYNKNTEIMPNYEYDNLYDELKSLEQKTGTIYPNSPTQKIGFEVVGSLNKINHKTKMLSLDKTKSIEDLKSFLSVQDGLLSWKLDGLTVVLTYNNGKLSQAITRGNGEVGEDVTHNAKVFKNIPLTISYKGELIIRGEAVIGYKDFDKINEKLDEEQKYKNPRNLCSGTVRQLNSEIVSARFVNFFPFSLVDNNMSFNDLKSNQLEWLKSLGFSPVSYEIVNANNLEEKVLDFESKIITEDYGSDGLVLTFNSLSYSNSLGTTSKFPKDSLAFKWADETKETILQNVIWNTSRTGLINPIAVFESVELEGTTVNRASLHNLSIVENLELGIGDTVVVYKANMIIPQILENLTKTNNLEVPSKCSVCGDNTEVIKLKDVKVLKCINPNCKARLLGLLTHFTARDAMNIEGLSEATLDKFINSGFINNYLDIFYLEKHKEQIETLEGFGKRSASKILDNIEKAKDTPLENFIYALGIENVGLSNARLLTKFFDYDFNKIMDSNISELVSIEGFGEIIANSIVHYFSIEKNKTMFKDAILLLRIKKPDIANMIEGFDKFKGKTFVITGALNISRKDLEQSIINRGGKVSSSVSKNTSYLINNDVSSNSSKNKKANELGVPIISEQDFMEL